VRHWRISERYNFFGRRAAVAEELFERDIHSIDGIVLSVVGLSSLAEWRCTPFGTPLDPLAILHVTLFICAQKKGSARTPLRPLAKTAPPLHFCGVSAT
jgi:hypothetical protein